jgi:hypothetical protein
MLARTQKKTLACSTTIEQSNSFEITTFRPNFFLDEQASTVRRQEKQFSHYAIY